MSARRTIAVVTGSRAEYGLLYWLMKGLKADPYITFQLIVTGMHMLPQFGNTLEAIRADGFEPTAIVPMDMAGDTEIDVGNALASVTFGMTEALSRLRPDILVLLGDRFEILAAAQAALCLKIPVAHIHGGEVTEGNIDESMRHAITKMSHLHFVASDIFRRRVVQLGENPKHVFTVGAVGLENLFRNKLPSRAELETIIGMPLRDPTILVTYHPTTLADANPVAQANALCAALDWFSNATIIITGSNADAGGQRMMNVYKEYAARKKDRVVFVPSLGQNNYLAALTYCSVVVGNSSSGLIEAPSAGVPTVNIGDRQKGRLHGQAVLDCSEDTQSIAAATSRCLIPEMKHLAARKQNPYFVSKQPSETIIRVLKSIPLQNLIRKPFFDWQTQDD